MGLEFLARVRRSSIVCALVAGLATATYRHPLVGLAVTLGAAWTIVNLRLIEALVVAITGPARGSTPALKRAATTLAAMTALFAAGAGLLTWLDPIALLCGFLLPFGVLVLKAVSLLVLESRFWKRLVASPWRATLAVAVLALSAWWAMGALTGASAQDAAGRAPQTHATTDHAADAAPPAGAAHGAAPEDDAHAAGAATVLGGEGHGEGGHGESGPQKFPNVLTFLIATAPDAGWAHFLHQYEPVIFSLFVGVLLCLVAFLASRNAKLIPGGLQNAAEFVVEKLYDFVVDILGPRHGPRFVPFLGTLFIYIFVMNAFGLILFMDSPTSNLNVTFALGLTVFIYVQWIGLRGLGPIGYVDHLLGQPRNLTGWILAPIMLPIHVLGELAKPISLSCRLFGNIFGEDMLMVAFATLGISMLGALHAPFGVPMHAIFFPLALLTSALQALVFTVLSTIYFLLMLPHDDHGHEGEAHHAH